MNYLPFAGYWFYGATSGAQRASFYCTWGLLATAPLTGVVMGLRDHIYRMFRET